MPKISRVFIRLDGEKEVYRHGEMVQGTVSLEVAESFPIRSVRIFRYGEALTKWDPLFEKKVNVAKERYLGHYVTLFGNKAGENSKPYVTLAAGKHNYKFSFRLPSNGLASSFEGDNGAVRYWLTVLVATPTFSFNQKWYRCITVLEEIDVNKPVYKVPVRRGQEKTISKALGLGNAGTLVLNAECDRKAYCPGEKIALNVLVKNNTTKDMGKLKARISQISVFKANGESVSSDTHIRIIEGESSIAAGQERKWENQLLHVDALPPSSTNISCHIIEVRYYVKVWVEVPWGTDLFVSLPITIGTVPLKQNTTSQPVGAASNAFEIDTSTALCYSKCNHGISHCGRSDGVFPNLNYVPMCTYVPNYQFTPLAGAQPTQKAVGNSNIKGKIPNADKSVPTVSTTASNVPVNSSVMPVLPPSYEEVLQMNSQKAKPEAAVVCEPPKSNQFGLFIRFQDSYIAEFRSYIMKNRQHLKEREGELLALSVQPISEPGIWPEQTSIAIFVFPSAEKASDWFKTAPGINETSWMKSCDAATLKMNELQNGDSRYFGLSYVSLKNPTQNPKELRDFIKLTKDVIRRYRIQNGIISLAISQELGVLHGDWVSKPWFLSLSQCSSLNGYGEFRRMYSQVKEYIDGKAKFYNTVGPVLFQTEDVSPYLKSDYLDSDNQLTDDNSMNDGSTDDNSMNDGSMDVTAENEVDNANSSDQQKAMLSGEINSEDIDSAAP